MRLVNVYKHHGINWFAYKCVFGYGRKLTVQKYIMESELESWTRHRHHLGISKRKPNENK